MRIRQMKRNESALLIGNTSLLISQGLLTGRGCCAPSRRAAFCWERESASFQGFSPRNACRRDESIIAGIGEKIKYF
jgi:hypothetical protein